MYEIDRTRFGAFIAQLRREKGLTQQELAEKLFISNKAVSKWETGVSIPDVALLIPLSEILEVTVTELLQYQRMQQEEPLNSQQVEDLVKQAISYPEDAVRVRRAFSGRNLFLLLLCALIAGAELLYMLLRGYTAQQFTESVQTVYLLSAAFGIYFMLFAREELPAYYDENCITAYNDGPVRMNLGAIPINNRNWPHILKVCRVWSLSALTVYPALHILMTEFFPAFWARSEKIFLLILLVGGLLLPLIIVAKRHK